VAPLGIKGRAAEKVRSTRSLYLALTPDP